MQLKEPDRYFWELNSKTGYLEKYDAVTGKIVAIHTRMNAAIPQEDTEEIALPDGTLVVVEKGVDISSLNHIFLEKKQYNPIFVDLIAQKIAEGGSLTKICKEPGMPSYATVCRWRRLHPEIEESFRKAREDRAEYLRDLVFDEAFAADEDNLGAQKLRVDALKWLAGKDDPNKYEAKPDKMQVNVTPSVIMVQTGISRGEDAEVEVEAKDVRHGIESNAAEAIEYDTNEQVLAGPVHEELIGDLGE